MENYENEGLIFENLKNILKILEENKSRNKTLWFGISGSWRNTSEQVEKDVRETTSTILRRGHGIVSGGALNVDYFATDEALRINPTADKIRIYLPVTLKLYLAHYRKRAKEGVITSKQAENLGSQLENLQKTNYKALICNPRNKEVNSETYFERNTKIVDASDAILAFQVNGSEGVEDTCKKALQQKKPICLHRYKIDHFYK
jgi:23S rRNA pseudoU1915 N3-methylase RlmH